jgi:hypothetical protein
LLVILGKAPVVSFFFKTLNWRNFDYDNCHKTETRGSLILKNWNQRFSDSENFKILELEVLGFPNFSKNQNQRLL